MYLGSKRVTVYGLLYYAGALSVGASKNLMGKFLFKSWPVQGRWLVVDDILGGPSASVSRAWCASLPFRRRVLRPNAYVGPFGVQASCRLSALPVAPLLGLSSGG